MSRYRAVVVPAAAAGMCSPGMISLRPRRRSSCTSDRFDAQGVSEIAQLTAITKAAAKRARKGARRQGGAS